MKRVTVDYSSVAQMREALRSADGAPFDYVIHNAGVTKTNRLADFMEVNAENTRRLLEALDDEALRPKRFLLMSSMGSYGDFAPAEELRSDMPQRPNTCYGRSKRQAERYAEASGIPCTILCPTGVYGAGEEDYFLTIRTMARGFSFVSGRTPQRLSFVYVKDLAAAACHLLLCPAAEGRRYLISDGERYTDRDFTRIVAELLGRRVREVRVPLALIRIGCRLGDLYGRLTGRPIALNGDKYAILSQRSWQCDISPLLETGFRPAYDLERGLRDAFAGLDPASARSLHYTAPGSRPLP